MALMESLKVLADTASTLVTQVAEVQAQASAPVPDTAGSTDGSLPTGSGKIYSQTEVDQIVASTVQPLQDQISALQDENTKLKADVQPHIDAAIAAFKAEAKAKYEAQQVAETQGETGFAEVFA
jgi:hypothetical protein